MPADDLKAVEYLEQAAALGSAMAQHNLAWRYLLGEGVVANLAVARKHFEAASAGGWASAAEALSRFDRVVEQLAQRQAEKQPPPLSPD